MAYSWVDLPNDDFCMILGYQTESVIELNNLIAAYHDIRKDDVDSLQLRIDRLEDIIEHLTAWINTKLDIKDKVKHLKVLKEIAEQKCEYLLWLTSLNDSEDEIEVYLDDYHKDLTGYEDYSYSYLVLNKLRMYSVKKRESWGDYWVASLDPCHRQLTSYLQLWEDITGRKKIDRDFFMWLETQYVPCQQIREQYLDENEIPNYKIVVNNGKLYNPQTETVVTFNSTDKKYLFVINLRKELYIIEETDTIFHSCITNGKPVLSAGKITVANGDVIAVSFESGHYIPDLKAGHQLFRVLKEMRYEFPESIEINFFYDRNKYTGNIPKTELYDFELYKSKLEDVKRICSEAKERNHG